ncbi:helix-turn-helix domain-containing protein [Macrococcus equi]|uniref:helix-turn-helix domain-containing protein n=1 Tax=Macrococcus equi TaxID=3395462 RepID=UPI0039BDE989
MTKRKQLSEKNIALGRIIKQHRLNLSLEKSSRRHFLDDRVEKGILDINSISEKTLTNIENGNNVPSLETLLYLSHALEVDFDVLLDEIKDYIV